jgi:hypothetical protein
LYRWLDTLVHLLRGNIGSGVFAMGEAFMHAGLLVAPLLTLFLAVACVHSQHILVSLFINFVFSPLLYIQIAILIIILAKLRQKSGEKVSAK